jgi:copper homeostasis protein
LGVNGFVFGILKDAGIDKERNAELVRLAGSIPCTFHRAFDKVKNMSASLEDVISCGFKRILTSGMNSNAYDGRETLGQMQKQSAGRIGILPGGGVRSSNCIEILKYADTSELHTSAITNNGVLPDPNEIKKILSLIS